MKIIIAFCLLGISLFYPKGSSASVAEDIINLVGCYMEETTTWEKRLSPLTFKGFTFPTMEEFERAEKEFNRLNALEQKLRKQEGKALNPQEQIDLISNLLRIANLSHKFALGKLHTIFTEGLFGLPKHENFAKAFDRAQILSQWESAAWNLGQRNYEEFAEELKERRGITMAIPEDLPRGESFSSEEFPFNPVIQKDTLRKRK